MKSNFHIIRRKGGLLEARYWARYPDGTKKPKSLYDRDEKILKEKWIKASAQAALEMSEKSGGESTSTFLLNWIENIQNIKETTRNGYRVIIKKHILPKIGTKPISEIDLNTLQNLLNGILKEGNSVRTAQLVKCVMSKALRRARVLGKTTRHIDSRDIELPIHKTEEVRIWTAEELKKFLEACRNDEFEWFFLLYTTYGLRRGEAIPLEWKDIDWEKGTIYIYRQYTRVGDKLIIESPKTNASIRKLPILPHIEKYLNKLNPNHDKAGLIVSIGGEMVAPDKISRRFKSIIKNIGLPMVKMHSLRHTVATLLKDIGVPIKDTQMILGHSTSLTTLKYYQHTDIKEKRENLIKYSNFVGF